MTTKQQNLINQTVVNNLQMVSMILGTNRKLTISDSSSSITSNANNMQTNTQIQQYYPILQSLLQHIQNPFKSINTYIQLLSLNITNFDNIVHNQIFQSTFFNPKIYILLTCYLYEKTCFYKLNQNAEKIVDVFYKFVFCQHGELMEQTLKSGNVVNIGKWFYQEGLQRLFKRYYFTAQDFTVLVSAFMLKGLAVLFTAAICILGKRNFMEQLQNSDLIRLSYIKKYGLE